MLVLTDEETKLLRELEKGERTISGNNNRKGLSRLMDAKYVIEHATNISDTIYTITDAGRAAVSK